MPSPRSFGFRHVSSFLLFLHLTCLTYAALLLRPAYVKITPSTPSIRLSGNVRVCRRDYPRGFSLQCEGQAKSATFFINGRRRRIRRRAPFLISGLRRGLVRPWRSPRGRKRITIACRLSKGARYAAQITFSCEKKKAPSPPSSSIPSPNIFFKAAGTGVPSLPVVPGTLFCPRRVFGKRSWSVLCEPPSPAAARRVKWAKFYVNGRLVRTERRAPFYIAGDYRRGGRIVVKRWTQAPLRSFVLRCELSDGSRSAVRVKYGCDNRGPAGTTVPVTTSSTSSTSSTTKTTAPTTVMTTTTKTMVPTTTRITTTQVTTIVMTTGSGSGQGPIVTPGTSNGCVVIDTRNVRLSNGWTNVGDGIGFRMENDSTTIVGPNVAPLYYFFTVPLASRYGVALDMTIGGFHDFNDCWVKLQPGNFQLMKNGIVNTEDKSNGWIKAFHNAKSRRATLSSSVDGNAHSIASGAILQPGQRYRFGLAGRSNKLIIHRIVLFACEGTGCQRGKEWARGLGKCRAEVGESLSL